METPVLHKLDRKIVIFRGFGKIFQNYWIPIKFLILIKFPNILHWKPAKKKAIWVWSWDKIWAKLCSMLKKLKKQAISLGFFHILLGDYLLKQKAVVLKPPEWKFMAIAARNANF